VNDEIILRSAVFPDTHTERVSRLFDYAFTGSVETRIRTFTSPEDFGVGAIVGPSGSGKSTLLAKFGVAESVQWGASRAVVSHFDSDGESRLSGVGLNSVPAWMKPYHVLSTGERFRADLARRLRDGAVVDEFTSTVDRNTAASCARAMSRFVRNSGIRRVVVASCHYDILDWLEPDWVFDTQTGVFHVGGRWERPAIRLEVFPCDAKVWPVFAPHHYLSESLNSTARCWLATWDGVLVAFASALPFPNGNFKNGWRGHRTVVLPDFQGLGIGVRLSDSVGRIFLEAGCRYFSKTVHPRMGAYRDASPLWRATSKNRKARPDYSETRKTKEDGHKMRHVDRVAYSHEFIGP